MFESGYWGKWGYLTNYCQWALYLVNLQLLNADIAGGHRPLCLCFWHSALIMDSSIQQKLIHVIFILSYNWPYRIDLFVPKSIWTLKILNLQIGWVQDQKLFSSEDSSTYELILPFMFLSYVLNGVPIISTLRNSFPVHVSGSHFLSKL